MQPPDGAGRRVREPVQSGGGHELLRVGGQRGEQGIAAVGVEFAENVVQQQQRRLFPDRFEQIGLREFERQRQGALLALRAESRRRAPVEVSRRSSRCGPTTVWRRRASSSREAASAAAKSSPAPG